MRTSLDTWEIFPEEMIMYLRNYGKHFSKKMYEFAVNGMYKINKQNGRKSSVPLYTREQVDDILKRHGLQLENNVMYDAAYVMSMAMSDFYGTSLTSEQQLAQFVKDYVDDVDQADGFIFGRFHSDCILKGEAIDWAKMI